MVGYCPLIQFPQSKRKMAKYSIYRQNPVICEPKYRGKWKKIA
jgi:hypothetical protein